MNLGERDAPRFLIFACVGAAMANETWKFVQAKSKQTMKQALGIRDEKARMKVTSPLAVAPIAQEDGICGCSERLSTLSALLV